jgi:AraC-like DNA-binding protein
MKSQYEMTVLKNLSKDLIYFERNTTKAHPSVVVDVFANFWVFAIITDLPMGFLSAGRHGIKIPLQGTVGIFAPPHAIIEWHLAPGTMNWKAFISFNTPPRGIDNVPFVFQFEDKSIPSSSEEIFKLLIESENRIEIGKEELPTSVTSRTKSYLDEHFMEPLSITDVANNLKYAHTAMDRAFKKNFGLSPIAYRNQKRIISSTFFILRGESKISLIGHQVGFSDLSRFNKQFKKITGKSPSCFGQPIHCTKSTELVDIADTSLKC